MCRPRVAITHAAKPDTTVSEISKEISMITSTPSTVTLRSSRACMPIKCIAQIVQPPSASPASHTKIRYHSDEATYLSSSANRSDAWAPIVEIMSERKMNSACQNCVMTAPLTSSSGGIWHSPYPIVWTMPYSPPRAAKGRVKLLSVGTLPNGRRKETWTPLEELAWTPVKEAAGALAV
eukprot:6177266-Pleurochrysis_carterae.AAC.2